MYHIVKDVASFITMSSENEVYGTWVWAFHLYSVADAALKKLVIDNNLHNVWYTHAPHNIKS